MTNSDNFKAENHRGYKRHAEDDLRANGFCRYVIAYDEISEMIDRGKMISMHSKLLRESKDAGALKVNKDALQEHATYYGELLTKTGLFRAVLNDVDSVVFPQTVMHLVSDNLTKRLIWHRDSYRHRGQQIVPLPSPLKLAVYLTDVDKLSGVTGLNTFLRNSDFNNRYLDTFAAFLMHPFAKFHKLSAGTAMLFDGRLMHYRGPHKRGQLRQAIIFSLSRDAALLPKIEQIEIHSYGMIHALMNADPIYKKTIYDHY